MLSFLRRHPVLCLLILTPGIPEYLSSSSPLNAIVLNPPMFLVQIAANLGLYGPGALLVREATIRWKKGWASVLLLGAAYGILEEGIALSTLFNPNAGPVGELGTYGHWLGVSWVWLAGILPVHMIYSISIPILLLGIALPETRGRLFLNGRKLALTAGILGTDVTALYLVILLGTKFWMGWPVLIGSLASMAVLVLLARRIKPMVLRPKRASGEGMSPRRLAVVGVLFFPSALLSQFVPKAAGVPASVDFVVVLLVQGIFLWYVLRSIGKGGDGRDRLALAFGLILPIAAVGVIAEIRLPLTLIAVLVMVLFFRKEWRKLGFRERRLEPLPLDVGLDVPSLEACQDHP